MPLSVGMLVGVFAPSIGGIQSHTLQLARKLVERGVVVHVVTRHQAGLVREETIGGIHVHRVGDAGLPRGVRVASYLFGALSTIWRLGDSIDIVHAHQLLAPAFVGWLSRICRGKPLVLNPHSPGEVAMLEARGIACRLQLAAVRRYADAFISICSPIAAELRRVGMDGRRIHSIPNGVDTEVFRPASAGERAELRRELGLRELPTVVYAGRLAWVKGVDVLLEAWPRVEADAQLCVVGDGEESKMLRARATGLRNVRFVGAVQSSAPYLRAADAAVLPSRGEGLSVALLEAMACGLPTVATAVGGSVDAIHDGVDGILVRPEDPQALGDGMVRALHERSLGVAARRRIVERHSIDAVTDLTIELYTKLQGLSSLVDPRTPEWGAQRETSL